MSQIFCKVGASTLSIFQELGKRCLFLLELCKPQGRPLFYGQTFLNQLGVTVLYAAPLVMLTALFTGMVLALQSAITFHFLEMQTIQTEIVVFSILRELGPVLTGLMMAGHIGSSIAAELASMRATDQMDALVSLSVSPISYLVVPKFLATLCALPILTLLADVIGIVGGYISSVYQCHFHGDQYLYSALSLISYADLRLGLIKAFAFGAIIGFVGIYEGFFSAKSALGVGISARKSVVTSCLLILLTNYIITFFFGQIR